MDPRKFLWLTVVSTIFRGTAALNSCLDSSHDNYRCGVGTIEIDLGGCGLLDDDHTAISTCFNSAGRGNIKIVDISSNLLTTLPSTTFRELEDLEELYMGNLQVSALEADVFDDLSNLVYLDTSDCPITSLPGDIFGALDGLEELNMHNMELATLPAVVFQGLTALSVLDLSDNKLGQEALPVNIFEPLTNLSDLFLEGNKLSTLPAGMFSTVNSDAIMELNNNPDLQCLPTTAGSFVVDDKASLEASGECVCEPEAAVWCAIGLSCLRGTAGYTCGNAGGSGDPHMIGFKGQRFDFTGEDGSWYAVLKDGEVQVNMRVTSPLPELHAVTYITGISIISPDLDGSMHTIVILVDNPEALEAECSVGVSPCLGNGALQILLDGRSVESPSEITLGSFMTFGAVNIPGECRPFGFERYWARKVLEAEEAARWKSRKLRALISPAIPMGEWILADGFATNMPDCESYVESAGGMGKLFALQSEHVSFQLNTPSFRIRLNYGKLHQLAMRDPSDQFDLPDHVTHQMNLGFSQVEVSDSSRGVLGETMMVKTDPYGQPIMNGLAAISGVEGDYKVDGPLGVNFKQDAYR